jgi:hypothetical protein
MEKQSVWNKERIELTEKKFSDGFILQGTENPFYDINKEGTSLRKPNINYEMNDEETLEFINSSIDVTYFAEKFCKVKNENSKVELIPLRDYQFKILEMYDKNRFSLLLASRQIGKCVEYNTLIDTPEGKIRIGDIYYKNTPRTIWNWLKHKLYNLLFILDQNHK